jgi:hypothetical protein
MTVLIIFVKIDSECQRFFCWRCSEFRSRQGAVMITWLLLVCAAIGATLQGFVPRLCAR